jgi:hypothetical protein
MERRGEVAKYLMEARKNRFLSASFSLISVAAHFGNNAAAKQNILAAHY